MTNTALIAFWGRKSLTRWTKAALADVAIPPASKRFLHEVGLPSVPDWPLRFDEETKELPRTGSRPHYRVLGFEADVIPICLDESRAGRVVCYESEFPSKTRFVNSSVRRYAVFLTIYQSYRLAVRGKDKVTADKLVTSSERRMRRCEGTALARADYYWSLIIEQMHDGLL